MRDSFVFYRSFYEAIKDLPRDVQGEVYTAIMEYSLNGITTENLKPIARSIFTLIKPLIDANNKKFENGHKGAEHGHKGAEHGKKGGRPPKNPPITPLKPPNNPPNEDEDVNEDVNDKDKEILSYESIKKNSSEFSPALTDFEKFNSWIKENAPYCSNPKNFSKQITGDEFRKLKEKYTGTQIADIILQIENRKDLRKKYNHLCQTILNWAKKEYGEGSPQNPVFKPHPSLSNK